MIRIYFEGDCPPVIDGEHLPDCPSLAHPLWQYDATTGEWAADCFVCSGCVPRE